MQHVLRVLKPEEYFIEDELFYEPVGDEIPVFEAAYRNSLPILLKGPTGVQQDTLHGAHGVAPAPPADHSLLPR